MDFPNKLERLSLASLFRIVYCWWVRLEAYPRVDYLKGASLGQALALPATTRLGWKGLPRTNTLVYYRNPKIMAIISFMIQAPAHESIGVSSTRFWKM